MVPEFIDACFGGSSGSLVKVRTQYGVHLIQVTDQKGGKPAVKLFVVAKSLKPSQSTEKAVYAMANQFAASNTTAALFDTAANKMNIIKRTAEPIRENDHSIPGFPSARDVVKWTYQAEIGNVSGTYRLDDKLIVAKLVSINKIGIANLDQVRAEITQEVIREKKAAMIIKDMQSKIAGKSDLASIAQAIGDTIHHAVDENIYNPFIAGFGPEFAMMGAAFSGKYASKPSAPIKGSQGVFIIQTGAMKAAPATTDYSNIEVSIKMQATGNLEQLLPVALKRQFTVTDNRSKFF
jgi:peptidyl-prolyl cis-trans isomerase D